MVWYSLNSTKLFHRSLWLNRFFMNLKKKLYRVRWVHYQRTVCSTYFFLLFLCTRRLKSVYTILQCNFIFLCSSHVCECLWFHKVFPNNKMQTLKKTTDYDDDGDGLRLCYRFILFAESIKFIIANLVHSKCARAGSQAARQSVHLLILFAQLVQCVLGTEAHSQTHTDVSECQLHEPNSSINVFSFF